MKNTFILSIIFTTNVFAQKETFDLASYSAPKGWKKEKTENSVQFTKEDATKGTYCTISLFKALPASTDADENFNLAWTSVVKEMVPVSSAPEMQNPEIENGWETLSGYAPFDKDGNKGVIILVTASSNSKMVNLITLTNTDVYEAEITAFIESINLMKITVKKSVEVKNVEQPQQTELPVKSNNGFAFTTTNFDDGWTGTEQADWVQVTKGNILVLLHYPNKAADEYNVVLLDGLKNAWNILVAPRYNTATNMDFKSSGSWESIEFGEADMIDNATSKKVYVVLFQKNFTNGSGIYIEFITPDKKTFEDEFGSYENASANWGNGPGFVKMASMANYNKFAVSAADLTGLWSSNFTGMTQYVNAYTGASAGANTHASNESFQFVAGSTYKWDLGVASGFTGNIKFQSVNASGKFNLPNNWQIYFSKIEGKPKTYDSYFSCIKGNRILWLSDVSYPRYSAYGKAK